MTRVRRLLVLLMLNLVLVLGLVLTGVSAHSLAVLAAGGDYLLDAVAVGIAVVAVRISGSPAATSRPASGRSVATTIAALVNSGWLLLLELLVAGAAIDRLVHRAPPVDGLPVLVVSSVAALVMLFGALVLRADADDDDGERDLSVAAVLLDTVADASAAAGVAVGGAIMMATDGWYWLDPAIALAVALIFSYHASALLARSVQRLRSRDDGSES
jgi:cobalt-zinc-cadmium efflux system protein